MSQDTPNSSRQQSQSPSQTLPPQWQQPPPSQKTRKPVRRGMKIGCGAVAAIVILVTIIAIATAGGSKGSTSTTNTQATQSVKQNQPTQAPTKPQPTQAGNVIGNPIAADSTWTVTLNSISTSQGDQFNVPKSGDIFIVLNVTLLNTSSQGQTASSLLMFSLQDTTGQTYDENITLGSSLDGSTPAGGKIRGVVNYEVPKSLTTFTFQFNPDLTASNLVDWTVKD